MVSEKDVRSVAENSRINLEEDEAGQFAEEFENILEVFDKLDQVDTEDVEPAFHPIDTGAESREDTEEECLGREEVFANTDNEEDGYFRGPSVN